MYNFKMHPSEQLCDVMRRVTKLELGTVAGGGGAISDEDGAIWMTPHGISKNTLTPDIIAHYSKDGTLMSQIEGTDEAPVNIAIFKKRPDIKAILHTHSPGILGFMLAGEEPNFNAVAGAALLIQELGGFKTVPFYIPGSQELVKSVSEEFAKGYNVVFLKSHGIFVGANTIFEAFKIVEVIDNLCNTLLYAQAFGKVNYLDNNQIVSYINSRSKNDFDQFKPQEMSLDSRNIANKLITMTTKGYEKRIINNIQGIISSRISEDEILVTPSGKSIDRANLKPEELIRVNVKKARIEENKSAPDGIERLIAIYKAHPEYTGVTIASPADVMGFAVTDAEINTYIDFEIFMGVHKVKKLPFGAAPEEIASAFGDGVSCVIVENDCIITISFLDTLKSYGCMECCSAIADVMIKMAIAGKQTIDLPKEMVDRAFLEKTGKKS